MAAHDLNGGAANGPDKDVCVEKHLIGKLAGGGEDKADMATGARKDVGLVMDVDDHGLDVEVGKLRGATNRCG